MSFLKRCNVEYKYGVKRGLIVGLLVERPTVSLHRVDEHPRSALKDSNISSVLR